MAKKTLFEKALNTELHSRFAARAEDLGRPLTDEETKAEAQYQLAMLPWNVRFEDSELFSKALRQLKALLK